MAGFGTAEATLGDLESSSFESEADAMAALTQAAIAVNQDIQQGSAEFAAEGFVGGLGDKLKKILERLFKFVKKIATEWGALSYSVGVSLTGVSISVEWAGPKG